MLNQTNFKYHQILNKLLSAEKILLTGHKKIDGDGLGSILALYIFLKSHAKEVSICLNESQFNTFDFLPHTQDILHSSQELDKQNFDIIVFLDCVSSELSGLQDYLNQLEIKPFLINIDHHLTNAKYADINFVDPQASSACEILFYFFYNLKLKINPKQANALLTGIITDTDFFINSNTTQQTFFAASHLIRLGAKTKNIFKNIYCQKDIKTLNLWGEILSRLSIDPQTQLATTAILQDDLEKYNSTEECLNGFANFLNSLDYSEINGIMVLKEKPNGIIKGSLRTTRQDVDVSKIAQEYQGGGHRQASGFEIAGELFKTKKGVWKVVKK